MRVTQTPLTTPGPAPVRLPTARLQAGPHYNTWAAALCIVMHINTTSAHHSDLERSIDASRARELVHSSEDNGPLLPPSLSAAPPRWAGLIGYENIHRWKLCGDPCEKVILRVGSFHETFCVCIRFSQTDIVKYKSLPSPTVFFKIIHPWSILKSNKIPNSFNEYNFYIKINNRNNNRSINEPSVKNFGQSFENY